MLLPSSSSREPRRRRTPWRPSPTTSSTRRRMSESSVSSASPSPTTLRSARAVPPTAIAAERERRRQSANSAARMLVRAREVLSVRVDLSRNARRVSRREPMSSERTHEGCCRYRLRSERTRRRLADRDPRGELAAAATAPRQASSPSSCAVRTRVGHTGRRREPGYEVCRRSPPAAPVR